MRALDDYEKLRHARSGDEIAIDIGASSREETEAPGVGVTDPIVFKKDFVVLNGNRYAARGLDAQARKMRSPRSSDQWEGIRTHSTSCRWGYRPSMLSVPVRYLHSPVEMINGDDLEGLFRLLLAVMNADREKIPVLGSRAASAGT